MPTTQAEGSCECWSFYRPPWWGKSSGKTFKKVVIHTGWFFYLPSLTSSSIQSIALYFLLASPLLGGIWKFVMDIGRVLAFNFCVHQYRKSPRHLPFDGWMGQIIGLQSILSWACMFFFQKDFKQRLIPSFTVAVFSYCKIAWVAPYRSVCFLSNCYSPV